jgi:hypothetical protein
VSKVDDDDLIPIDEVIEAWQYRARQKPWWAVALECLRPTPEDNAIVDDDDEER